MFNVSKLPKESKEAVAEVSFKMGVVHNYSNFTGKHVLESFFNKVSCCNFIKKRDSNIVVFL